MSDYIMNRESLKRHCEAMCKKFKDVPTSGTYGEHRLVLELLEQTEWIPCSERLPKAGEYIGDVAKYYLVQNEYGDMMVARYTHSEYWEQIYQLKPIDDEIVAWMPLPKPYEPTCNTCKYNTAAFMPCNACKDKSEYEPQERSDKE